MGHIPGGDTAALELLTFEEALAAAQQPHESYDVEKWLCSVEKLYENEVIPHIAAQGLSATVYTQVSDVEDEVNGLVTYDRRVVKADAARLRRLAEKLKF